MIIQHSGLSQTKLKSETTKGSGESVTTTFDLTATSLFLEIIWPEIIYTPALCEDLQGSLGITIGPMHKRASVAYICSIAGELHDVLISFC